MDINQAGVNLVMVTDQPLDSMGLETAEVGPEQHIGDNAALLSAEAVRSENRFTE
jgi:hypothetical protein